MFSETFYALNLMKTDNNNVIADNKSGFCCYKNGFFFNFWGQNVKQTH